MWYHMLMISLLLAAHVSLAVISLILAGAVAYTAAREQIEKLSVRVKTMWISTLITTLSGVALGLGSGVSITRVCGSMLAMLAFIYAAHYYQSVVAFRVESYAKTD